MSKYTYDYVKEYIENEGYQLLSTEYKNNHTKLKLLCPENHDYEVGFKCFKNGIRCSKCNGNKRYNIKEIQKEIEKEGYKLLSTEYKNAFSKLKIQCNKGHTYDGIWNNFQQGKRCPECNGAIKLKFEYVKSYIESFGYKLLSTKYVNNHTKLKMICPKNHNCDISFSKFQSGGRCQKCNLFKITSKGEKEVLEYVKSIYSGKIIENDRTKILNLYTGKYLELDIYCSDIKFAIEYCGDYYHSTPEVIVRDKIKLNECEKLNINLLVIKESEWLSNKKYFKEIIRDFIYD